MIFYFDLGLTGGGMQGLLYELPQTSTVFHLIKNVQPDFPLTKNIPKTPTARCNTSYKPKTLNPTWNEDFVLDVKKVEEVVIIKKSVNLVMSLVFFLLKIIFRRYFKIVCLKDCLRVDIWDFNDEESVNDKFGKINQVG